MLDEGCQRRITRLEDRIRDLEIILGFDDSVIAAYRSLGLRKTHCALLGFLMKREIAPREQIYTVLFGDRPCGKQPDIKVLDVYIYHIRGALAPLGIQIATVHSSGWQMLPAEKTKLKNWLSALNNR
jgi:DNA-binding response OmpR family regulator